LSSSALARGSIALAAALAAAEAGAWPASLLMNLNRDARKLVPRSLARLLAEREPQILDEVRRFPPQLNLALAGDLAEGRLRPETLVALEERLSEPVTLLQERRVSEGLIRLGALMPIPAMLSDPVLSVGAEGYPSGVVREYYAFIEGSLDKIPVVLSDEPALSLDREQLGTYWQDILDRSRSQSPVILTEMFRKGRVVDHRSIDYRSPVFGVASLSYSRAVTAIAATWLAIWRDANGDLTRVPRRRVVVPRDALPQAPAPEGTPHVAPTPTVAPPAAMPSVTPPPAATPSATPTPVATPAPRAEAARR
jgi:hypothetical protein